MFLRIDFLLSLLTILDYLLLFQRLLSYNEWGSLFQKRDYWPAMLALLSQDSTPLTLFSVNVFKEVFELYWAFWFIRALC